MLPEARDLMIRLSRASWEHNTTGRPEAAEQASALGKELKRYFSDPAIFAELKRCKAQGGADDPAAREAEASLRQQERRNQLIFARWGMVMTHFERALYADPDQDLGPGDRLGRQDPRGQLPRLLPQLRPGGDDRQPLQAHLVRELGDKWLLSVKAGDWLRERIFRPGNLLPWNDRLEQATGEKLNPRHWVEQFVG